MISENFLVSDGHDVFSNPNRRGGTDGEDDLSFVTGAISHRPRDVTVQMRVRERRRNTFPPSSSSGSKASQTDAESRKLTLKIKQAKSVAELLGILDGAVDGPIFSRFQASATYHSLVMWKRTGRLTPNDKTSQVLPRLAARVQDLAAKGQLEPREVSNVLWSLGQLSDTLGIPKTLLNALVKSICRNASGMNPQDLSNNWLSCVQLKSVAPEVLDAVPAIAGEILTKAKDMKPQELSNSLWALAKLKDDASHEDVQKLVAALVRQIPDKANSMIPQHLSNTLWAAAQLKDIAPDVKEIVPAIVAQIQDKAKDMIPQQLSNSLWAATRLKDDAPEVLRMVPSLVEEIPRKQADFKSQETCNCLEALVLLQDSVSEVGSVLDAPPNSKKDFLGFAAKRFSTLLPTLQVKSLQLDIPLVVWACARVNFYHEALLVSSAVNPYHEALLVSSAQRLKSGRDLKTLNDWSLCALLWSYDVLDPDGRFAEFKNTLASERTRRGLSDSDVSESALGIFEWTRAKG